MTRNIAIYLLVLSGTVLLPFISSNADTPVAAMKGISKTQPDKGTYVEVDGVFMVPYTSKIPGTDIEFEMIPVPGGSFQLGSPESEADRNDDEGPQVEVKVDPMWVAKLEINWEQYREFMAMHDVFKEFQFENERTVQWSDRVDAVTAPTPLYTPAFTYEFGEDDDLPATTMTLYAAQQFTKWLSGITGQQYRLPTEGEWEYAARGGTSTAYSWGDSEEQAEDFSWSFDNSESGPSPVGTKLPNPFGLHDMHGNVGELTINEYVDNEYQKFKDASPINAIAAVTFLTENPSCVVRGGTWEDDVSSQRSAARFALYFDSFKVADPNDPKSPWWYTDDPTRGIGFRLFRSYQPLPTETIKKFWDTEIEEILDVVEFKVMDGRAYLGRVDPELPEAAKEYK